MRRLPFVIILSSATACSGPGSILEPKGPGATRVAGLWWLLFWIAAGVLGVVVLLLGLSLARRRRVASGGTPGDVPGWGHRFVVISGFVLPVVILLIVFGISLRDLNALNGTDAGGGTTSVEVIGHVWWWEAVYDNGAVTANEIHIPVGEPVEFVLTTADVIHSFWIPSLHPKRDMVPGKRNVVVLQADEPGRHRGVCAEFCGLQHANMALYVVADPNFDTWVAEQARDAAEPSQADADGQEVFLSSTCVGCHTIRGTSADTDFGPDLTHLASRETLFAGRVDNTRADLAAIITDPQSIKPGSVMPPTQLEPDDLESLLDFLETLR